MVEEKTEDFLDQLKKIQKKIGDPLFQSYINFFILNYRNSHWMRLAKDNQRLTLKNELDAFFDKKKTEFMRFQESSFGRLLQSYLNSDREKDMEAEETISILKRFVLDILEWQFREPPKYDVDHAQPVVFQENPDEEKLALARKIAPLVAAYREGDQEQREVIESVVAKLGNTARQFFSHYFGNIILKGDVT